MANDVNERMKQVSRLSVQERLANAKKWRQGLMKEKRQSVSIEPVSTVDGFIESILNAFESIPDEFKEFAELDPHSLKIFYDAQEETKPDHALELEIAAIEAQNNQVLRGGNTGGFSQVAGVNAKNAHLDTDRFNRR